MIKELPYDKFKRLGADSLTEAELLAVILRTGTRQTPVCELAEKILELTSFQKKGLNGIHNVTVNELMAINGIGEVKAIKIKCIAELSSRMARMRAEETLSFQNPESVARYYMEALRHEEKEKILLVLLDNKLRIIEEYVLSIGTINASLLSPRDVFIRAFKTGAVSFVLLHNHPSGIPNPSKQDIAITKRLNEIGKMIDIPLVDHIIIGDNRYISLKEADLL